MSRILSIVNASGREGVPPALRDYSPLDGSLANSSAGCVSIATDSSAASASTGDISAAGSSSTDDSATDSVHSALDDSASDVNTADRRAAQHSAAGVSALDGGALDGDASGGSAVVATDDTVPAAVLSGGEAQDAPARLTVALTVLLYSAK